MRLTLIISSIFLIFISWAIRQVLLYKDVEILETSSVILGLSLSLLLRPLAYFFCFPGDDVWQGTYKVNGISSNISIQRDSIGVPYIKASSLEDLVFGQGFIHGRERPWQMESMRLVTSGRLSEVVGSKAFQSDKLTRGLGIRRSAEEGLRLASNDDVKLLSSYAKGVSAGFQSLRHLPLEFHLLHHTLNTTWTLLDSVSMMRMMALVMNRGWTIEVGQKILSNELSESLNRVFDIVPNPVIPPVNSYGLHSALFDKSGNRLNPVQGNPASKWAEKRPSKSSDIPMPQFHDQTAESRDESSDVLSALSGVGGGSNAWVISGEHTESGGPIVVGDPHLALNVPGFWFPASLSSPSVRAVGVSAAGIPGILIGHTNHTAWSITLNFLDLEDLFIVKLTRNGTHYLYDDEEYPLEIKEESIPIKNELSRLTSFRWSHHGPLISDIIPSLRKLVKFDEAIALASPALRAPIPLKWPREMLHATDWADLLHATDEMGTSGFSMTWATTDNDIGVFMSGSFPERSLPSSVMRDGTSSKNDWTGVVPSAHLPHIMNPPDRGFIFSANQRVADDNKSIFGKSAMAGGRAWRIDQLLKKRILKSRETGAKVTVDEMREMQMDFFSYSEDQWKELIHQKVRLHGPVDQWCLSDNPELHKQMVESVLNWDSFMSATSIAAAIVETWMQYTLQELIGENRTSALNVLLGKSVHPMVGSHQEYRHHWKAPLTKILHDQSIYSIPFQQISNGRTPAEVICSGLLQTSKYLSARLGTPDLHQWTWGKLTTRMISHPFAEAAPIFHPTLSLGPVSTGGNGGTLFPIHLTPRILKYDRPWLTSEPTGGQVSASLRVVMDIGNFSNSWWLIPPGVSGWISSSHYGNQLEAYRTGFLYPMLWEQSQIDSAEKTKLILVPLD